MARKFKSGEKPLIIAVAIFLANVFLPRYIDMISDGTMRDLALLAAPVSVACAFLYWIKKWADERFTSEPVGPGAIQVILRDATPDPNTHVKVRILKSVTEDADGK